RLLTVLADVRHHQPSLAAGDRRRDHRGATDLRAVPVAIRIGRARERLDELDVAPVLAVELPGVVVRVGCERGGVALELVPLLARDLAGLAADADRRVGEEADGTRLDGHQRPTTFRTIFV